MHLNSFANQIQLDFRSNEPLYLQISRQIQQMVLQGTLKGSDQLPTVRELATELRINFNTVARAYRILDEMRLISTQRGRGTYIWEEPSEAILNQLKKKSLEELSKQFLADIQQLGYTLPDAIEELTQIDCSDSQGENRNETNQ